MNEVIVEGAIGDFTSDPNFILIVVGALCWLLGFFTGPLGPLFVTGGFVLTCLATAATSLKRPVANAWPGLILGAALYLVGNSIWWIPLVGLLSPFFVVSGGVLVLFFAVPLAIQQGGVSLLQSFQKLWQARMQTPKEESPGEPDESQESEDQ
ncbi:MAG: hypothetical protein JSW05_10230 [Candidatus Thorarchaeota archaeon]|nr:MAG: hypothetical protein JSW05_10230 [Candidatus Thorarchaeota archaeon]